MILYYIGTIIYIKQNKIKNIPLHVNMLYYVLVISLIFRFNLNNISIKSLNKYLN